MPKKKGTPEELDYLFERDIIDEEDYVDFWSRYWALNEAGRKNLINEYLERAIDFSGSGITDDIDIGKPLKISGTVTKNKADATKQAKIIGGRVVRRNKRGQFSKRGTRYQAIRKGKRK